MQTMDGPVDSCNLQPHNPQGITMTELVVIAVLLVTLYWVTKGIPGARLIYYIATVLVSLFLKTAKKVWRS